MCISIVVGTDDSDESTNLQNGSHENGTATNNDEEEPDFEYAQTVIRACWTTIKEGWDLGRSEVREVMMAPEITTTKEQEREAAVRMWCDILRLRG